MSRRVIVIRVTGKDHPGSTEGRGRRGRTAGDDRRDGVRTWTRVTDQTHQRPQRSNQRVGGGNGETQDMGRRPHLR